MPTYIDALPKELRNELEFYKNSVYRIISNILANKTAVLCNPERPLNGLESTVLSNRLQMYAELRLNVVKQIEELEPNSTHRPFNTHKCYYHFPSTQLCTLDKLLKYLDRRYHSSEDIAETNLVLTNLKFNEQIVKHYIGTNTIFAVAIIMN